MFDLKSCPFCGGKARLFGEEYEETKELIHNGETQLDSLAEGFTEAYHIIKYVLPTVDAVRWCMGDG